MKNFFIKISLFSIILSFLLIFTSFNVSLAYEIDDFTYDDYLQGIEDGWISEDVSYDELIKINKESEDFFNLMKNSADFTEVYSAESFNDFEDFKVNVSYDNDIYPLANVARFNPGDIFIMNSSASAGLSGHAVMAMSNESFITADKNRGVFFLDRDRFKEIYGGRDISVYRANNYYWGVNAVGWAKKTYYKKESNFKYKITIDLDNISNTYCSKIVYHSYRFGVGKHTLDPFFAKNNFPNPKWIVSPYNLTTILLIGKHGTYDGYSK